MRGIVLFIDLKHTVNINSTMNDRYKLTYKGKEVEASVGPMRLPLYASRNRYKKHMRQVKEDDKARGKRIDKLVKSIINEGKANA